MFAIIVIFVLARRFKDGDMAESQASCKPGRCCQAVTNEQKDGVIQMTNLMSSHGVVRAIAKAMVRISRILTIGVLSQMMTQSKIR